MRLTPSTFMVLVPALLSAAAPIVPMRQSAAAGNAEANPPQAQPAAKNNHPAPDLTSEGYWDAHRF